MRLKQYDYSQNGAYFITICTHNKLHTLCKISRDNPRGCPEIQYTPLGNIALKELLCINEIAGATLDKYVIMPNHIHMIISLNYDNADSRKGCPYSVPQIIGRYKSIVSNGWLKICKQYNMKMGDIWQRSYFDHIIRNENEYLEKWQYIENNPYKWEEDDYYNE